MELLGRRASDPHSNPYLFIYLFYFIFEVSNQNVEIIADPSTRLKGILLIAQLSCEGNLCDTEYTNGKRKECIR